MLPLAALAGAFATGETVIRDAEELRVKESDRVATTSAVLRALGIDEGRAFASLRIGLGRFTTAEEVDYAVGRLVEETERLREAAATAGVA